MIARISLLAVLAAALAVAACGFQLRGAGGGYTLPAELSSLRLVAAGASANEPLVQEVRDALLQAGARLVDRADAPTLTLLGERVASRVASVNTATGKASEYVLQYSARFSLGGPQPLPAQTVQLRRDYTFDPAQVLAKEREERELVQGMRRDAAQQIVRRVSRALTRAASR